MTRLTIIGGGLTGILAAFEAHRLGVRDIRLHERFDRLGGVAVSPVRHGVELREGCVYFGPPGDPIRETLTAHGVVFDDIDNRFGAVSRGRDSELRYVEDFGGPALDCHSPALSAPTDNSLAGRIAAYPPELQAPLSRYAQWHLGADVGVIHASAATPLAINRVYPVGADLAALAAQKQREPLANDLLAIPRSLWGRSENVTASLPRGGFAALFARCHAALEALGVTLHPDSFIPPRLALAEVGADDVLVWAASPTPLFKAMGAPIPKMLAKRFASYVHSANWSGPCPFYVQNFTAEGACFRAYVYESGGQTPLTAECVAEASEADLRDEVTRLLSGFGELSLGSLLGASVKPRWIYHTVDAIDGLGQLRRALAARFGAQFVCGAWEPYAKAEKHLEVNAALADALTRSRSAAAA